MSRYSALIWDWNGTLLDDVELSLRIVNELLGEFGLPALSRSRYREIFDVPVSRYWERAGLDLESVDFGALSLDYCSRFEAALAGARLFASAEGVLGAARRAGARQLLLSNTEQAAMERAIAHFELGGVFDAVRGMSHSLATGKLEGARDLMERFGLDARTTLMVGDTAHEAELARSLGVDCILVSDGHQSPERLARLGLPVLDTLAALPAALAWETA